VSEEKTLVAHPPLQSALVKTYGWSTLLGLRQEVEVTLAPGVPLGQVFDLSVFGPFRPGETLESAARIAPPPYHARVDPYGEEWRTYELPHSRVEIGCQYSSSGGDVTSFCAWTLEAKPDGAPERLLLEPQLHGFLGEGGNLRKSVDTRVVRMTTANGKESIELYLESRFGPGAYWWDEARPSRREGPPPHRRRRV
jgi:hypothetical protein